MFPKDIFQRKLYPLFVPKEIFIKDIFRGVPRNMFRKLRFHFCLFREGLTGFLRSYKTSKPLKIKINQGGGSLNRTLFQSMVIYPEIIFHKNNFSSGDYFPENCSRENFIFAWNPYLKTFFLQGTFFKKNWPQIPSEWQKIQSLQQNLIF